MSSLTIIPSILSGEVTLPPSKSLAHRAIICASLAREECVIKKFSLNDDTSATLEAMKHLGLRYELINDSLYIRKFVEVENASIDCGESGSTMRFLIPIASALGIETEFLGHGSLENRTACLYTELLEGENYKITSNNGFLPIQIEGKLTKNNYKMAGNISSQFVSGLLMALPLIKGGGTIELTTTLESRPYVDMTIAIMEHFGVKVEQEKRKYTVTPRSKYKTNDYKLEADYSAAAFWLFADLMGANIDLNGLNENSVQGDKAILSIIDKLKGKGDVIIDVSNIPDLAPVIAVYAGIRSGSVKLVNAKRLEYKESNRLKSTSELINVLSGNCRIADDGLEIIGVENYKGATIDTYHDHRIAMAATIASLKCNGNIKLNDVECVTKSYVNFFDDYIRLGGKIKR